MHINFASDKDHIYTVSTPVYEGPLDLLLHLIERTELDITKLSLAQVTDQYLGYLQNLQERVADDVSGFIVIAAKLVQIKSEALLPRPLEREVGEEDTGEMLARQLVEYKRYKNAAKLLGNRDGAGLRTYIRPVPPPKIESKVDMEGFELADLVEMALNSFTKVDSRQDLKTVFTPPTVTVREKVNLIARSLRQRGRLTLQSLFSDAFTRMEVVVTFLAMLELIKRHMVYVYQEKPFGVIEIEASEDFNEDGEFELEFGE